MITFIIRRLIAAVFLLVIVSMVIFAIFFLLPKLGGQTNYGLATQYVGRNPTREAVLQMEDQLGLNKPVWEQLWIFIKQIVSFDWGRSWATHESIGHLFATRMPATLTVMIPILILQVLWS